MHTYTGFHYLIYAGTRRGAAGGAENWSGDPGPSTVGGSKMLYTQAPSAGCVDRTSDRYYMGHESAS